MNCLVDFALRRAVLSDLVALVELENQCFDAEIAFCRRQIRRHILKACIMVALDKGGRVVAQATLLRKRNASSRVSVRVYSLAVSPNVRGKGVARKILSGALLHFIDKQTIRVSVEVESGNPAETLYRSMGFKEKTILRDYYGKNRHGVRMLLAIPQQSKNSEA